MKQTIFSAVFFVLLTVQIIAVDGCQEYTVKSGDSLSKIASRYGTTWQELHDINPDIEDPGKIYPGQVINVPPCSSGSVSQSTTSGQTFSGDMTYYDPSTGVTACGIQYQADDMIAALSFDDFEDGSCNKCAKITGANGKSVKVKIQDKCGACDSGDIDVSSGAFEKLYPLSKGRVQVTWKYVQC